MADEPRVQQLLDDILESQRTPEEVCVPFPELLPEVRRRWQQMRLVGAGLDALFPTQAHEPGAPGPAMLNPAADMPRIPGYEVEAVLGRGGMGVVYNARHLRLNRPVALKMLLAGGHAGPHELARFQHEAEAVASLRHANIVQVFDVGDHEGRPYFTMEFVDGGSLAQKVTGTPLPAREAAAFVATLADAVEVAHQGGVVHRDLKPANVLLTADGTPKISDFGLARRLEGGAGLTQSGVIVGTPSYMAPEQAQGKTQALGPAVDTYALGAILYELVTGRPPFRGESPAETVLQAIHQEPVPPARLNAKVPRDLETICLKCLHKEPQRRYASAGALADDMRRFLQGEAIAARPEGLLQRLTRGVRRRPTLAVAVTASTLLVAALVSGGLWVRGERAATGRAQAQLDRLDQARRDQEFAGRLDAIHLNRVAVVNGRFDMRPNEERADREYEAAFREAGLGGVGDDPEAVASRVGASNIRDELVAALDDWAVCARQATDPGRMRWVLEVARRADPNPSEIRQRLRDPALWKDRAALTELAATALADKPSTQLLAALGERLRNAGGDAIPFLRQVQQEYPGDFWANLVLASALLAKDPRESMRYFQAALAIRPKTPVVYNDIGGALVMLNRLDEAMEQFGQALRLDPDFAGAHNNLGYVLKSKGRLDEAIDHYQQAVRCDPSMAVAHCNLGNALNDKKRPDEAIEQFREALRLDPRLPEGHTGLCSILKARGGPPKVIEHYQQVLRADPEFAVAHAHLGIALVEVGQTDEAIDHFRHALRIDPQLAPAHHDLGLALYAKSQFDEAVDHLQQAVTIDPKLAPTHGVLGAALMALGRYHDAQAATRRCLDLLPPQHPRRASVAQQLERCEHLLSMEAKLPAVIRGEVKPANASEALQLAEICHVKTQYAAARLAHDAFADKPTLADEVEANYRYNAACAAALAGCGRGEGGGKLSEEERARWRRMARDWLRADLTAWGAKLENDPAKFRDLVRQTLAHWRTDTDLERLRDPGALDRLPAPERQEWRTLWGDVDALLKRSQDLKQP
jgi:serine/threonine-protein kinase